MCSFSCKRLVTMSSESKMPLSDLTCNGKWNGKFCVVRESSASDDVSDWLAVTSDRVEICCENGEPSFPYIRRGESASHCCILLNLVPWYQFTRAREYS